MREILSVSLNVRLSVSRVVGVAAVMALGGGWAMAQAALPKADAAQDVSPQTSVPAPTGRVVEVPVQGLVRRDLDTVALRLPGKRVARGVDERPDLLLHDFSFE